MKVLSTLYYHVDLEELSVKEFDLRLERDPTSDSYTLFARDSFLDPIRKDPAFIQFNDRDEDCQLPPRIWMRGSRQCQNILMLRWG